MTQTDEQLERVRNALRPHITGTVDDYENGLLDAARAVIDTTEDRVATLHALLNDSAVKIGEQRLSLNEQRDALEKIADEASAKEPSNSPTVGWPRNWSEDLRDTVNEMILEAFADGYARACWELGQIADAALKTGEAK